MKGARGNALRQDLAGVQLPIQILTGVILTWEIILAAALTSESQHCECDWALREGGNPEKTSLGE